LLKLTWPRRIWPRERKPPCFFRQHSGDRRSATLSKRSGGLVPRIEISLFYIVVPPSFRFSALLLSQFPPARRSCGSEKSPAIFSFHQHFKNHGPPKKQEKTRETLNREKRTVKEQIKNRTVKEQIKNSLKPHKMGSEHLEGKKGQKQKKLCFEHILKSKKFSFWLFRSICSFGENLNALRSHNMGNLDQKNRLANS